MLDEFGEYVLAESGCCEAMKEALVESYYALFEDVASTATHRTKRVIREMFPQMAGRWDSVAVDDRGNPILDMGHKQQTVIEYFEREIRNNFFHDGENQKFEPGVARIAYGELKMDRPGQDTQKLETLKKIVKMISEAHALEYNADLNGLSYSDLDTRFGATVQKVDEELKKELKETKYTPSDYIIEEIPEFDAARKFFEYTYPKSRWCLTYLKNQWDSYTSSGMNKVYFAHLPNYKDILPKVGENAPLDSYGLSLISIIVTPFENLRAVTTRWNHENGGSDHAMDAKQLSKLLGGNVFELCPPPPKPEQHIERIDADSVKIGDQIWMCHNLQMPADPEHGIYVVDGETYFTWEAAMRAAKDYENGWRLPSAEDWNKLCSFCGGESMVGHQLKSTSGWTGNNGFDIYGFDGKPAGWYNPGFARVRPMLHEVGSAGYFWSSTSSDGTSGAVSLSLNDDDNDLCEGYTYRSDGLSVRLLKDSA